MQLRESRRTGKLTVPLFLVALAVGAVAVLNATPLERIANTEHADAKHATAPTIRRAHRNGLCRELEAYVSARRGTLLVLCKLDDAPKPGAPWGGLIWRVLEKRNGGMALLGPDDSYECTVFAADRSYWDRVITRDGYAKAADTKWFGPLRWLIYP